VHKGQLNEMIKKIEQLLYKERLKRVGLQISVKKQHPSIIITFWIDLSCKE